MESWGRSEEFLYQQFYNQYPYYAPMPAQPPVARPPPIGYPNASQQSAQPIPAAVA